MRHAPLHSTPATGLAELFVVGLSFAYLKVMGMSLNHSALLHCIKLGCLCW